MAKNEKDPLKKLSALMDKALQRGEKLERTLTKLVAQSDPGSEIENFLKAVQGGLKAIRKNAKSIEGSSTKGRKSPKAEIVKAKAPKGTAKKSPRKAAPKEPVPADIRPLSEVSGQE